MTLVYAFPPVGVVGGYWTMEQPVSRSRSRLTGREYVSAAKRRRLLAGLTVHGRRQYGSGRLEALWRYLDGGVNLVRLTSCRLTWGSTVASGLRGGDYFVWTTGGNPLQFTNGSNPLAFFHGTNLTGVLSTVGGFPTMTVGGLPPGLVVGIPGEFLTLHLEAGNELHMIANEVRADSSGVGIFRLVTTPSSGGRVSVGASNETAVFRVVSDWPKSNRYAGVQEDYTIEFRQVFEDETSGFEEVDPWN